MTRLRALRIAAGLSQKATGIEVSLDSTSVAHLEAGRFIASTDTARRLERFFNVAPGGLHDPVTRIVAEAA